MYLCAYNIIYFVIICILLLYTHEDAFYYSVGFSGDKTTGEGGEGEEESDRTAKSERPTAAVFRLP